MDPGLKLFVWHLPLIWTEHTIFDFFQPYGHISKVDLFKANFQSKNYPGLGCAYVSFKLKSEGEEAMAKLNHSQGTYDLYSLKQSKVSIRWADGEEERIGIPSSVAYAEYISKDGASYYWNTVTGRTQWNRPKHGYIIPHDQTSQTNELFVFYLPPDWDEGCLRANFGQFGSILSAKVAFDKDTGKSKGFGFVTFEDNVSAANAVNAMNGLAVEGKRLKVQFKKNSGE